MAWSRVAHPLKSYEQQSPSSAKSNVRIQTAPGVFLVGSRQGWTGCLRERNQVEKQQMIHSFVACIVVALLSLHVCMAVGRGLLKLPSVLSVLQPRGIAAKLLGSAFQRKSWSRACVVLKCFAVGCWRVVLWRGAGECCCGPV